MAIASGINASWYRRVLREPDRASPHLVEKLQAGLRRLQGESAGADRTTLVLATYGGFLLAMAPHYGVTPAAVRATAPQKGATADRHWLACSHARQAALYLVNTALGLTQRQLAAALGVTPAAVCLALKAVEDRRSDPLFDAALVAAQLNVTGVCDG